MTMLFIYLTLVIQVVFSISKVLTEDQDKLLSLGKLPSKQEQHRVEEIIRKSIFNEIDTKNTEHVRISEQVEPLIKKMMRTKHAHLKGDTKGSIVEHTKLLLNGLRGNGGLIDKSFNASTNRNVFNSTSNQQTIPPSPSPSPTRKQHPDPPSIVINEFTSDDEDDSIRSNSGSGSGGDDVSSGDITEVITDAYSSSTLITPTRQPATRWQTMTTHRPYNTITDHEHTTSTPHTTTYDDNESTTSMTDDKSSYNEERTHLYYYGPCMFCRTINTNFERFQKEIKRKQFLAHLPNYDFVFLVQRYPSGLFANILSFTSGHPSFPVHFYLDIQAPLPCACFTKARNTRYIVAGSSYAGKLILNSFYPLYEVHTYKDIEEIRQAFTLGRQLLLI